MSKIIRYFERLPYESYEKKRPKHEPDDSYFYLEIQVVKCMMRYDVLILHVYPVRREMTATKQIPTSYVYSKEERKLKEFLIN